LQSRCAGASTQIRILEEWTTGRQAVGSMSIRSRLLDGRECDELIPLPSEDIQEVLLCQWKCEAPFPSSSSFFVLVPIIFIISGICSLFWPRMMWFLAEGWKFKDVQPSGCYLVAIRIGGLVSLIVGVVSFVILWGAILAR
jgi:hypothetical protein